MSIKKVVVCGGGTMGSGIAEVCARSGLDTVVLEANAEFAEKAQSRIGGSLDKALSREKISADDHAAASGRLSYITDVASLGDCDMAIEAIIENEQLKRELFATLDAALPEHAILASNTSSIALINLATATKRPDKVVGFHFFNPATVQKLVEIVAPITASEETLNAADSFATNILGKTTIRVEDRAGFVVNRLLVPYLTAAISLLDTGQATAEAIDIGMVNGCAHPMGPLALCDLIGLDIIEAVADVLYEEFKEPFYAAPPLLRRMTAAGMLGRKSGRGFFDYS